MSAVPEKGTEVRELLGKIGHPLLEVRSRSLRSIVFKLSNGLISYSELVKEKEFLVQLLEWFNHDEWVLESQVLTLIEQLAQHEPAARTLVDIGGVEFLSQLRQNCDLSLHPLIDGTLEHLLTIPSTSVVSSEALQSSYGQSSFNTEMTTDVGSYHSQHTIAASTTETPKSAHPHMELCYSLHSDPYGSQIYGHLPATEVDPQLMIGSHAASSWTSPAPCDGGSHYSQKDLLRMLTSAQHHGRGAQFPYRESCVALDTEQGCELSGGLETTSEDTSDVCLFPWLRLTLKDCHILATTQSRLQSSNSDTLLRSCHFIHDVLFEDFPAEVFLQRPSIVKCLLHVSGQGATAGYAALLALLKLTRKLRVRIKQAGEQSMRIVDRITLLMEEQVKLTARLRSNNLPDESRDHLEELTTEMLEQLQSEQLSMDQLFGSIMTKVSVLLTGYLNKHLTSMTSHGDELTKGSSVAADVALSIQLMVAAMELMEAKKVTTSSAHPLIDVTLLSKSVESVCLSLGQCLSKWRRLTATQNKAITPLLQLVCCTTLHLSHCLSRLVRGLALSDKDQYSSLSACSSLPGVMQELMMNGVIGVTQPHLQQSLLPLFEVLDPASARLYCRVKDMVTCFNKMAYFLKITPRPGESDMLVSTPERIRLALESLQGLWFTCNEHFIREAVSLSFSTLTNAELEPTEAKTLLLSLLCHGSNETMETAYSHFVKLMLEVLPKSENATKADSPLSCLRRVILDADILYQVCCLGAVSESDRVANLSRQLLRRLLFLWEDPISRELKSILLQWMPYVEVSASEDKNIFEALKMLHSHGEKPYVRNPTKIRCYLRLLFSQCIELRVWSFTQLMNVIVQEHGSQGADQFSVPSQPSRPLHDLLATAVSTTGQSSLKHNKSYQLEDVLKLRHILRSTTMDVTLKKVALEQAALLLQDQSLHEQLVEEGFSDDLLSLLQPLFDSPSPTSDNSLTCIATPCIQCLYLIAYSCDHLRQELSANSDFLLGLFKVGLLNHEDKYLLHSISKCLIPLVFDTVTRCSDSQLKLPFTIAKRLKLPFLVETYKPDCGHSISCILDPTLLTSDPILSNLRVHYHVSLTGGVTGLTTAFDSGDLQSFDDDKLSMSAQDIKSLKSLHRSLSFDELAPLVSCQAVTNTIHLATVMVASKLPRCRKAPHWRSLLEKFLVVQPRTTQDVELLTSVLQFITTLLTAASEPDSCLLDAQLLVWLVEVTCLEDTVCVQLFQSSLADKQGSTAHRTLLKALIQYFTTLSDVVFGSGLLGPLQLKSFQLSYLCEVLCHCLDVTGSPDYYNLSLLEEALKCIVNLTSSFHLSALIAHNSTLILNLMVSLRQVLWSFTSGRGIATSSFIGKTVVFLAGLSLIHLVQCSSSFQIPQGWWFKWMSESQANILTSLSSLIVDRDTKVQYCGYSLIALLCGKAEVTEMIVSHWSSKDPFGLWGVCLQTALGHTECVLVRQQAFFVLVNLSTVCSNERKWSSLLSYSSGELSLNSGRALELLLETHKLFSLLLSVIKTQNLARLKLKLLSAESGGSAEQDHTPEEHPQLKDTQDIKSDSDASVANTQSNNRLEGMKCVADACVCFCNQYVVSGWCRLVNNLLQAFPDLTGSYLHNYCVITSLTSVLEPTILKHFLEDRQKSIHCRWWVRMYTDITNLLKTVALVKPESCLSLLTDKEVMVTLCGLLSAVCRNKHYRRDLPLDDDCLSLCSSVLSLLQLMVHKSTPATKNIVFSALLFNWRSFVDLLMYTFELDPYFHSLLNWDLRKHGLALLNSLLVYCYQPAGRQTSSEVKQTQLGSLAHKTLATDMTNVLDSVADDGEINVNGYTPSGSQLCSILLKAYEGAGSNLVQEQWLVGKSLGLLLASSVSAKRAALKGGLLEVLMEELKSFHTKLCMESLEDPHHHSRISKESPTVDKLVVVVNLLRNFQHKSPVVKLACVKNGLAVVVQQMWSSCAVNRQLLVAVLKLLCVLTGEHQAGRISLATCVKGSSNCLLQNVVKTATHTLTSHNSCISSKLASPYGQVLLTIFSLLSNCALSQECRAVLKKTGYLSAFSSLNPKSEKSFSVSTDSEIKHASVRLSSLWIKLLVNLSFSSDGQQMIIKQPDSIDVLLDVYSSNCEAQPHCLLVLRNLCFYGPSKTLLASNENFLNVISSALDCWPSDKRRTALAASAVWALLFNCAKIRCSLKKGGLCDKLTAVQSLIQSKNTDTDSLEDDLKLKQIISFSITQALNLIYF